ncbi:ubiquinol-cytochrome C chaperone-domain-containing protein [Lipomyces japonicus]|uniref:ubiquinol-cytochrome C chaperone-domain-containing protein n=1 Tax=Lipomyces japonicus TaxID=56871 RepID=UPI0034CF6E09
MLQLFVMASRYIILKNRLPLVFSKHAISIRTSAYPLLGNRRWGSTANPGSKSEDKVNDDDDDVATKTTTEANARPDIGKNLKTQLPTPRIKTIIDKGYNPYPQSEQEVPDDPSKSVAELSGQSLWKVNLIYSVFKFFGMDIEENQAAPIAGRRYMDMCKMQAYHPVGAENYSITAKFYYEDLGLPPTLNQWFQITALHAWMLLVRMRALPEKYSKVFEQTLIDAIFLDIETRIVTEYKIKSGRLINNTLKDLNLQLKGSVLAYDEGLMGSDAVLASALWRNIFNADQNVDMAKLALLTQYVRTHVYVLEKMSDFDFAIGRFAFLPPWIEQNPESVLKYQPAPIPTNKIYPGYESKFSRDN